MRLLLFLLAVSAQASMIETWTASELQHWQSETGAEERFQLTVTIGVGYCEDWYDYGEAACGVSVYDQATFHAFVPGSGMARLSNQQMVWFNGPIWVNIMLPEFTRGELSEVLQVQFGFDGVHQYTDVYSAVFEFRADNISPVQSDTVHAPEPATIILLAPALLLIGLNRWFGRFFRFSRLRYNISR